MNSRRPLFALAFCITFAAPLQAQTSSVPSASTAPGATLPALPLNLDALPALDAPVSLDAPRLPVAQALAQIEQQSRVKLALPPELNRKTLVAVFDKRPLREVMRALGSLYGLDWSSNGPNSFSAFWSASPLERTVLHLGDLNEISARRFQRSLRPTALPAKLKAAGLDTAGLSKAEGVPLAGLAPTLRDEIIRYKRENAALEMLRPLAQKSRFQLIGGSVRLLPDLRIDAKTPTPRRGLFNRDGELVVDFGTLPGAPDAFKK